MDRKKFSVAISVYGKDDPKFFDRALKSIIVDQTVMPDEIVLVCDGPLNDGLNDVINKYVGAYNIFNLIRLEKNGGLGNALRIAVENSKYNLIARMDSDDISEPTRFEQQLAFFEKNPDVDVVGGNITEFIGEETNIVARRTVPITDAEIKRYMKKRCALNHVSVMYKKEAVMDAGGYLDWHFNEDYYLWIRMQLKNKKFFNTGTDLVNVRIGADMYARRGGWKYYKSEKGLQKIMLNNKMIGFGTYCMNCFKRFVVQVLMPNRIRGWIFRKFARNK